MAGSSNLRFLRLANAAGKNPYFAYGIGVIAVVIATLIRISLEGHILPGTPFITFFPTVVITTFFCGLWPGVLALVLSTAAAWYFFLPPIYSLAVNVDAAIALMSFVFLAGIDVAIVALLNVTIAKVLEHEKAAMLLLHEVQHRTNNLLTVVQSIAQRSLSADQSLAQGKQLFEARLQALAKTHHRLTNSRADLVSLDEIVRSELEVFLSRATITGDPILLRYEDAQRFALAIHELATNAAKHGALSVPHGKIQIAWTGARAGKRSLLKLLWSEAEGPILALPMREASALSY